MRTNLIRFHRLFLVLIAVVAFSGCPCDSPKDVPIAHCSDATTCGECMGARQGSSIACGWCVRDGQAGACLAGDISGTKPGDCPDRWIVNASVNACPEITPSPDAGPDPN